jgi:HAD superfamily hydrolase (TIGR01509 family)
VSRPVPALVTLDCGDTLLAEPRPEAVTDLRLAHVRRWVAAAGLRLDERVVRDAFGRALGVCRERLARGEPDGAMMLAGLVRDELAPPAGDLAELAAALDDPYPGALPPAPGAAEALARLRSAGVRLGIVSNTAVKSGRMLRRHLAAAGLLGQFDPDCVAFSDERGVAKPDRRIFDAVLAAAGCAPARAVHVGDLRLVDVAGARAAGLASVRYRGLFDDPSAGPEADALADRLTDLPAILGL